MAVLHPWMHASERLVLVDGAILADQICLQDGALVHGAPYLRQLRKR
jgi:hypothetical protein